MSINHEHFRARVVRPVLERMALVRPAMSSRAAEDLLVGTAAQESHIGQWLHQVGGGPAVGVYQMEPNTFLDLMAWLQRPGREELRSCVVEWASLAVPLGAQVAGNMLFATALARMNYYRKPFPRVPADLDEQARLWKKYWNTAKGKGTVPEYLRNYGTYAR